MLIATNTRGPRVTTTGRRNGPCTGAELPPSLVTSRFGGEPHGCPPVTVQKGALQHSLSGPSVLYKAMALGPTVLISWCHADPRTIDLGAIFYVGIFVARISAAK